MSKVDALRALREAKYAASQSQAGRPRSKAAAPAANSPVKEATREDDLKAARAAEAIAAGVEVTSGPELCGHQAIGGKRCIRPKDHPEKNHRYGKNT